MPPLIKEWKDSRTVTIADMIKKLSEYPQNMAVAYTWEGQITPVDLGEIKVMEETRRVHGPVLLLNAET